MMSVFIQHIHIASHSITAQAYQGLAASMYARVLLQWANQATLTGWQF